MTHSTIVICLWLGSVSAIKLQSATTSDNCVQTIKNAPFGTNCPDAKWLDEMVRTDPSSGKVFVDIGCNKGNDAVAWMERWDMTPTHFWSTQKWINFYEEEFKSSIRGNEKSLFRACKPELPGTTALQVSQGADSMASNTGICVEPMKANVDALHKAAANFGYNGTTEFGTFHIVHAAASDKPGEINFPDGRIGEESLHMYRTPVQVQTLDAMLDDLGITNVDILTIDTEGADAAVLKGATKTLKSVRYLEFEVHRDIKGSAWSQTTLQSVITDLAQKGFDCYWAGNNAKLLNIDQCWDDKFERGTWSNVVCAKQKDPWSAVLQAFAK